MSDQQIGAHCGSSRTTHTAARWLRPDNLEPASAASLEFARQCWDSAPDGVGGFDRLQVLLYIGGDLFLDADYGALVTMPFDRLPAGLVYRLDAFLRHASRFMRHGMAARMRAAA